MTRGDAGSLRIVVAAGSALCIDRREPAGNITSENGLIAAVSGAPEWRSPELASVSNSEGAALALLRGFSKDGPGVLAQLGGEFNAAIVGGGGAIHLLATDRTGSRPVAYCKVQNGIVFGPDSATLLAHPLVEDRIRPQAFFDYIYFHFVPSPESVYEGVKRLLPGRFLTSADGEPSIGSYWHPEYDERARGRSFADLRDELRTIVHSSVKNAVGGQQVGAFLSGGVDSTTITGVLRDVLGDQPPQTYSIGFDVEGYDELSYARIASKHYESRHREYLVTPGDIVDSVPDIAAYHSEPFGNASVVPTYYCARLAKQDGVEILLGGDGGDELFGGNERYAKQKLFALYERVPELLRRSLLEPVLLASRVGDGFPPLRKLRRYVEQAVVPMPDRLQTYNFLSRFDPGKVFEQSFLATIRQENPLDLLSEVYDEVSAETIVDKMLGLDLKFTLADNDLVKVRGACDLAGVEVAFPLLSDDLIDFSTALPAEQKVKRQVLRYFFKKAYTGFLPEETLRKSKHGFGLPFGEWAVSDPRLAEFVRDNVASLRRRKLFLDSFVDNVMNVHLPEHPQYYGTIVWLFLMLEQWHQTRPAANA